MYRRNTGSVDLQLEDNAAVCVVLASEGYPVSYEKGFLNHRTGRVQEARRILLFPCRNKIRRRSDRDKWRTCSGVTAKGKDLKEARANAYAVTEWVNFKNKYMRRDIGKAIDEV